MLKRVAGWIGLLVVLVSCVVSSTPTVNAEPLKSPNYRFDESTLGGGGLVQSNSAHYQVNSATGDTAVGNSASGNYQVEAGSKTTNDPTLSFTVIDADVDFGNFTSSSASVTTASFSVSNYTSYGYVVQILGNAPSNGNHTITTMNTAGPSQPGSEQFGINLVANTTPVSVGANPNNGQFGQGHAAPHYATSNQYRYVSGETIASSPKTSGATIYTISYLVNVASLTPGGKYTSNQTLVITGTY